MNDEAFIIRFKDAPAYQQPRDGGVRQLVHITRENGRRKRPLRVAVIDNMTGCAFKFYGKNGRRMSHGDFNNHLPFKAKDPDKKFIGFRHTVPFAIVAYEFGIDTARLVYDRNEVASLFAQIGGWCHEWHKAVGKAELFEAVMAAKVNLRDGKLMIAEGQMMAMDLANGKDRTVVIAVSGQA